MKTKLKLAVILFALLALNCANKTDKSESTIEDKMVTSVATVPTGTPPASWVKSRVENAQKRLSATEPGQLLWKSIEAHGGLSKWYSNGPLYYRFDYNNLKNNGGPDTYQTIDTWSSKARHQVASDTSLEFGWDGDRAWQFPADADVKTNPRFWALTPYYFIAMPFVLADEGIQLEYKGLIAFENNEFHQVLATFGDGMGDAPDDFYVLYIDTESYRVGGLRYIVSYPGFYPNGGHGEEKHMTYYGAQTIDGIVFPESIKTYRWDGKAPQENTVNIAITNMAFRPDTPKDYFDIPEGSRIMEGYAFEE